MLYPGDNLYRIQIVACEDGVNWTFTFNLGPPIEIEPKKHTQLLVSFENSLQDLEYASNYARWIQLQLAPKISNEYFGRVDEIRSKAKAKEYVKNVLPYVNENMNRPGFKRLARYLRNLPLPSGFGQRHQGLMKELSLEFEVYGLAYCVSHVLRGRRYATQLAGRRVLYTPHWTRKSAILVPGEDMEDLSLQQHREEHPWGLILLRNLRERNIHPDSNFLDRVLKTIRSEVQEDSVRRYPRLLSKDYNEIISEKIRILEKAGLPPIPQKRHDYIQWLSEAAVIVAAGLLVGWKGIAVTAVFKAIQMSTHKIEPKFELLFSFDRFKKSFKVPGLTDDNSDQQDITAE